LNFCKRRDQSFVDVGKIRKIDSESEGREDCPAWEKLGHIMRLYTSLTEVL